MDLDGASVRKQFNLNDDLIHVNNGSFGVIPREVSEARKQFLDEAEAEPDLWCRILSMQHFHKAADSIAAMYCAPPEQVTFVANATTGVQCVLNSIPFEAGDSILVTSLTYGTLVWHAKWIAEKVGAKVHVLDIKFPYTHDGVVQQYEEAFAKMEGKTKVALIDHISSSGALLFPIERLIPLCAEHSVLSLIDGAHAPGQLLTSEMDLSRLRPDFYVANLHKWAFVPRGCAFLYVSAPFLSSVRPQVTSWLIENSFRKRFAFLGTSDSSVIACIPTALRFIERLGGERAIHEYVAPLLRQGVDLVTRALGTERLVAEEFSAPYMTSFYLGSEFDARLDLMKVFREEDFQGSLYMLVRERIKVSNNAILFLNRRVVMRVTAHVFNTLRDFELLAEGLLKMREEIKKMTIEEVKAVEMPKI